jgi:cellulose synthase/poly-beta-1,6-N-acetylglucosamine synthase-like glycosyltransferase
VIDALLTIVAIGGMAAVVYSYAIYPFVLFMIGALHQAGHDVSFVFRKGDRRQRSADVDWPRVGVVISAYNEERHIEQRIQNLLALDYPVDRIVAYIGSDGSRDRTGEIIERYAHEPRIRGFVFTQNRGKANVLNDLVARGDEEIIAFSDANTFFRPDAIKKLVAGFADPGVGGVSGELRLMGTGGDNQDSLYWRIEQFLKFFEARLGALLGANGAIYAIRRTLWKPLAPDTICDDFCVAMNVAAAPARLRYEPRAWAEEDTPERIDEEFKRRVRIGIGNFQALMRHPEYLLRTSMATRFAYLSHKVLRWIAPHLLIVAFVASAVLAIDSAGWRWATLAQALSYGGAAALLWATNRGMRLPRLLKLVAFLFALNWAFLVASWRYARGSYGGSWQRTSR